jgi:hypothetical protein
MKNKVIGTNLVSLIELNGGSITTRLRWHAMPKSARPVGTIVYQEGVSVLATSPTPFKESINIIDTALAIHEIIGAVPNSLFEGIMEGWRLSETHEVDYNKAVSAVGRSIADNAPRAIGLLEAIVVNVPYDPRDEEPFYNFKKVIAAAKDRYETYCRTHDMTTIIGEPYDDDWTCLCGNDTSTEGFYPVHEGRWIEPLISGPWDSLQIGCASCGRIIDQSTTKIIGRMSDEALNEDRP